MSLIHLPLFQLNCVHIPRDSIISNQTNPMGNAHGSAHCLLVYPDIYCQLSVANHCFEPFI